MEVSQAIRSHSRQPLTHQLVLSLLKDYARPNDKIHSLMQEGILEPIKKGLYIAGPALKTNKPEPFLLANHILGPSYVSTDAALSYYGLIPERVYETSSMTTKATRKFVTPMGLFSYTRSQFPYYSFGIRQIKLQEDQYAMVASPEKALVDKLVTTAGLIFRSQKSTTSYLLENLRMDEEDLKGFNTDRMSEWILDAPKRDSLLMLINTIKRL